VRDRAGGGPGSGASALRASLTRPTRDPRRPSFGGVASLEIGLTAHLRAGGAITGTLEDRDVEDDI